MTSLRAVLLIFLLFRATPLLAAEPIYLGNGELQASAIATDLNGNVYITGSTTDPTISWATNVFHLEAPGSGTNEPNVFVLKLNPVGEPVRLTYLGGSTWDTAYALAVDTNGSVCVVGQTTSSNFPVVNPLQAEHAPGDPWVTDGFVVKLNPSGSSLTFATYFGGNGEDVCTAVKIDSAGSVVIAGNTRSTNLWTVNALQPTNASAGGPTGGYGGYGGGPFSGNDAFVAKFHPSGTSLVYATYLGGMSEDTANSLALDDQGNAYIAGGTTSTNFPTKNAFHGAYSTNESYSTDAFLAKLNATGQSLLFSTYLGGDGNDEINSVAVDHSGHAIVAGTTDSPNFPLTNAFPIFPVTNGDAFQWPPSYSFVTKFSPGGSNVEFSTLVAEPNGYSARITLDQQDTLWFAGSQSPVAASSYGAYFGFVSSLSSNTVGLSATKLVECTANWATDLAIAPGGVWALGAAFSQNSVDPRLILMGRSFLVRLTGTPAATNANPLIHLSRPISGGFWGTNHAIPLQATAADFGGRISQVEFLADGQIVGTITNAPYEMSWKAASLGIHTLQAIATDSLGARATSCPVNITAVVPSSNDQFEQCAPIFGVGVTVTGSIRGASSELGETSFDSRWSTGETTARTLWWCWLAPSNGNYTISMEGTEFSETVNVYTGYGLNDLTLVASQRDGPTGTRPFVTFHATAGTIYFISVAGFNEVAGSVVMQIRAANSPVNDDFENRILLSGLNATATGSNLEAATQPQGGPGGVFLPSYSAGADVWWSWTAPVSGVFSISTVGSSFPPQVRVYTGTNLTGLTAVPSAAWSSSSLPPYGELLTFSAIAGTHYEISVDSGQTSVGDIQLQFAPVSSPANDHFANAQPIVGANATVAGTTFGATAETGESSPSGSPVQRSVWWSWLAPVNGTYRLTVTSSNSSSYSLNIFTGSTASNLTLVASGQTSYNPSGVIVVFKAQAGVIYRIAVDSPYSAGGDVQLVIQPVTPPANDDFANRIALAGAPVVFSGTTANATRETGEPNLSYDSLAGSVWWTWTAPASSNYVLQLEDPDYGPLVQVFRGTTLTNLTPVSEVLYGGYGEHPRIQFNALAGETLQMLVANNNLVADTFVFSLGFAMPSLFPPNDYFSNRIAVIGADVEIPANNVGASNEPGEPGANCSIGTTVWWTWTAPSNGPFTISTQPSGYGLSVYTGTNVSALTRRAGNSDNVTFFAEAATAYQIVVGECTMPGREFTLRIHPAHPPANDNFSNRIHLTGSYVIGKGNNRDATSETNEPSVSGQYGSPNQHTVWWSWTAPANGKATVTASAKDPRFAFIDAGVAVYTGSALTALTRVNQSQWRSSSVVFQAVAGQTYCLQVASGYVGDIALTINGPKSPQAAQFTSAQTANGSLQLEFIATPWRIHTLEFSPDLENWFELSNTSAMLPNNLFWVTTSNGPARFYRLKSR